jgi:hypothetical protein
MKLSTSDPELVHQILANIVTAIERIERRAAGIERAEDFLASDDGIDRLDGITMMLIASISSNWTQWLKSIWLGAFLKSIGKAPKASATSSATTTSSWTLR